LSGSAVFAADESVDLLKIPEQQLRGIRGQDIAMIFQEPMTALNPLFTVGDQITEVLELKRPLNNTIAGFLSNPKCNILNRNPVRSSDGNTETLQTT
jgi:ABC-type microcin C transport system duplicated ATPase subunit YejF